jgi:hypothetical protein
LAIDFKGLDAGKLKKLTDPKAAADLNHFLEELPTTAGQNALIAAGLAWMMAAAIGLYGVVQAQNLTTMRAELKEVEALKPVVPKINNAAIGKNDMAELEKSLKKVYGGLTVKQQRGAIYITAKKTSAFGAFREAIGHVQNGGDGWRVSVERLCVGRECNRDQLAALLKISKVTVR